MSIGENIARIRERMHAAAVRAGRNQDAVALMAVSKTNPTDSIREAYAAGQRLFGENRVQEFAGKATNLRDLDGASFHLIGHLQSNKSKPAAELFHAIDSIDSRKLAERLNGAARALGKTLDVLIEVNVGGEKAKSGLPPESVELNEIFAHAQEWPSLRIRGLMTVPPFTEDPEGARPYFRQLRELRDRLADKNYQSVEMDQLSMGMSHDFDVAIEEGSTCVRVGTAIFGERPKP